MNCYNLKRKPKRIVSIGRNENLLKTKVNEQTLRTDVKRKVSFAYSQSDKHDLRRFSTNDVILENDSSDYDDDDDDDDDDSSDEGFNGMAILYTIGLQYQNEQPEYLHLLIIVISRKMQ